MPYADPEVAKAKKKTYRESHRKEVAASQRAWRRRVVEGWVRPRSTTCETCGVSVVVSHNSGRVPRYCSRSCYPREVARHKHRLKRPYRGQQTKLDYLLGPEERAAMAYAGRDRDAQRLVGMAKRRAAGVGPRSESVRDWLRRLKSTTPCRGCGQVYPYYVMQFDHRPDETKSFELSRSHKMPRAAVEAEVAKCDIVCANCHAARTFERVVQRPRPIKIKVCARCSSGYIGSYSEHSMEPSHVAALRTIKHIAGTLRPAM